MTRDDIIRMAREAGWSGLYITYNEPTGKADWKMVKESLTVPVTMEQIERFVALVAAAEREACAKVCEAYDVFGPGTRDRFAEAIRAALAQEKAEPVCKCDLRTRLVGDGCEVCNPKLAAEFAREQAEPLTEEEAAKACGASGNLGPLMQIVRAVERAHGIGDSNGR